MKHYSLQRKSYIATISDNFPETLKSLAGFVTCSSLSGIGFGIVYNMNLTQYSLESDERMIPTIIAFGAVYYAKKVYDNFKKERERMHQLIIEMDNEHKKSKSQMEGFITPDQLSQMQFQKAVDSDEKIVNLQNYRNILNGSSSTESEEIFQSSGMSQGKRKSLNNGIFKSNDTY